MSTRKTIENFPTASDGGPVLYDRTGSADLGFFDDGEVRAFWCVLTDELVLTDADTGFVISTRKGWRIGSVDEARKLASAIFRSGPDIDTVLAAHGLAWKTDKGGE